jgi:hypothetical protein
LPCCSPFAQQLAHGVPERHHHAQAEHASAEQAREGGGLHVEPGVERLEAGGAEAHIQQVGAAVLGRERHPPGALAAPDESGHPMGSPLFTEGDGEGAFEGGALVATDLEGHLEGLARPRRAGAHAPLEALLGVGPGQLQQLAASAHLHLIRRGAGRRRLRARGGDGGHQEKGP